MNTAEHDKELVCQVIAVAKRLSQDAALPHSERSWMQLSEADKFLLASQACKQLSISFRDWRDLLDRTRPPARPLKTC